MSSATELVIDTTEDYSSQAARLRSLGVVGVMRYFNPLTNGRDSSKSLLPSECARWADAGMPLGIIVEGYGGANGTGIDGPSGARDAKRVLIWLKAMGLLTTSGRTIWFAIDTDATAEQINSNEVEYFNAIRTVFDQQTVFRPQIGVYGSGWTCLTMVGTKRADHGWLAGSSGWAKYAEYVASNGWTMLQHIYPGEKWNGFNLDTNVVNQRDGLQGAGLYVPVRGQVFGTAPKPPMPPTTPTAVAPTAPTQASASGGAWSRVVEGFKNLGKLKPYDPGTPVT